MKNPNWTREELIIVLNAYMHHDLAWLNRISENHDDIIKLSNLIKSLTIFADKLKFNQSFRSPSGVQMKLMNFRSLDDRYNTGLTNCGQLDRDVWKEYFQRPIALQGKADEVLSIYCPYTADNKDISYVASKESSRLNEGTQNAEQLKRLLAEALEDTKCIFIQIQKTISNLDKANHIVNDIVPIESSTAEKTDDKRSEMNTDNVTWKSKLELAENHADNGIRSIKVGQYVQLSLRLLMEKQLLSDNDIDNLVSQDWSKKNFGLRFPFLKSIQEGIAFSDQTRINGYQRYWHRVFSYRGISYIACKEWFENHRINFERWFQKFNVSSSAVTLLNGGKNTKRETKKQASKDVIKLGEAYASICLEKDLFRYILKIIKELDEKHVYINTGDLLKVVSPQICQQSNYMHPQHPLSHILRFLQDAGVLVPYANTKRGKYIIEDYETFLNLINSPTIADDLSRKVDVHK